MRNPSHRPAPEKRAAPNPEGGAVSIGGFLGGVIGVAVGSRFGPMGMLVGILAGYLGGAILEVRNKKIAELLHSGLGTVLFLAALIIVIVLLFFSSSHIR